MSIAPEDTSRRAVLVTCVTAVAGVGCASCGSSSDGSPEAEPASRASTPTSSAGDGPVLSIVVARTQDVPVGGGLILQDHPVVLTQPTAGVFHAFTAICTHQGCSVSSVKNGTIDCPCHGSQYSTVDGSVVKGPAVLPLTVVPVTVAGGQISIS